MGVALLNLLHVYLNLPWAGCTCSLHDFCILTCSDFKSKIKRNDTMKMCTKGKQHTDSSWKANQESSLPARKSYLLTPSREEVQIQDTTYNKSFSKTEKRTTYIKLTTDDKISQMQKSELPSLQFVLEKGALVDREGFCSGCLDVCNPLLAHICSPKSRRSSSHPGCFSWTSYSLL